MQLYVLVSIPLCLHMYALKNPHTYVQLNRAKAVEKEKASLEGAKAEAEHYLSLQLDMSTKQNSLYSRYM